MLRLIKYLFCQNFGKNIYLKVKITYEVEKESGILQETIPTTAEHRH
jgi:hypothetical protein